MTAHAQQRVFAYPPRLMSVDEAARYLSIGVSTLRERGPKPRKFGARALYDIRDLDRWADALAGLPLDDEAKEAEGDDILARVRSRLGHGHD